MKLNPTDSMRTIKVLNTELTKTQEELDATRLSVLDTNRTVKSLDASVHGTVETDRFGNPITLRDKTGKIIYDDYGEPVFKRKKDGIAIRDSGVNIFYEENEPRLPKENDIWYKLEDNVTVAIYRYENGEWVDVGLDHQVAYENYINADKIVARSITGEKLVANTITSSEIATHTINANNIASHSITGEEIDAKTINVIGDDTQRHIKIDSDSVDVMYGNTTMASFGANTTIGEREEVKITRDGIEIGGGGTLTLPVASSLKIHYGSDIYSIGRFPISSGISADNWRWTVYSDGTLEATVKDTYTPDSGNTAFGNTGFYYKDTVDGNSSKTLYWLFQEMENRGFGHLRNWMSSANTTIIAHANGNTGSGYINVWRSDYRRDSQCINVRLLSNTASAMGTVTISYSIVVRP